MAHRSDHWLARIPTYTTWPQMPQAHGPFGKDALNDDERRRLAGIPLFLNVQTANAVREAHAMGGRALAYLSFMDTYVHTAGFENGTARVAWDPGLAQMLLIDRDGRFVNTPMDGTWRMWRCLVCNNTPQYVQLALDMVRRQMEAGVDGLFVDNSDPRRPCFGHGVHVGYVPQRRQVLAAIEPWPLTGPSARLSPEQLHRRRRRPARPVLDPHIRKLPVHRHLWPGISHNEAYIRLLRRVRTLVRQYGSDKVVVTNGEGVSQFADCVDGAMLESFIYSWAWTGPRGTWADWKRQAGPWAPYMKRGGRVLAVSYLGNTRRAVHEDALHSCAASALLGYMWSDYNTCKQAEARELRRLELGERLTGLRALEAVEYGVFAGGLAAINASGRPRAVEIPVPAGFGHAALRNLADGQTIARHKGVFRVVVPAYGGRILAAERGQV